MWSPLPCQLQVMQHEVSKDTAALLLNVGVLSQGQALRDHSLLHIELKAKVRLTPLSLLFSFSVLQWLHLHVASLCTCMRLTQSSITINQSHFLCGSWSFFTLLACVLVSVCMCVCFFVCIHFADMQAGGHPSRRQAGEGGKRGGGLYEGCSAEVQRGIIVSSCRVSCGCGEAKTAAVYPPSPPSPAPSHLPAPSHSSALPPDIKGSLWHGLGWAGGSAGAAALRAIYGFIPCEHPTGKLKSQATLSFFFLRVLSSSTLAVWHTLACSQSLRRHFRFSEIMVQQIV